MIPYAGISFNFLVLPIHRYQYYLFQACLSGKGIIRATSFSRVGIAASYVPLLLFHEPRIAALQVNLKEAYCYELAISLEMMLYHDDEPLTFDLVWQKGSWASHDAAVNDGKRDTRKTYRVRSQLVGGSDCCFQGRKPGWTGTELINPHGEQSCCLLDISSHFAAHTDRNFIITSGLTHHSNSVNHRVITIIDQFRDGAISSGLPP